MIKVLVAIAGSTALVCAPAAWADVLYLGGTGQQGTPTQAQMTWLIDGNIVPTDDPDELIGVGYPAQLWPVVGTLSLDRSVRDGTNTLDAMIPGTEGPVTVVGVSQGAVVINYEKRRLAAAAYPSGGISFITIGDPTNSDGGILAKLAPVHIPLLDFTIPPSPVDTYETTEIVREFDGLADWPDKPFNAVADLNALAGAIYIHPNYGGLDLDDEDNVITENGNTTHILVKTDDLPLTQVLRDVGVDDNVVDAIDKPLRKVINRAYDGPRPGKPAEPEQLNNARVKPAENRAGATSIRTGLKQVASNLRRLGQKRSTLGQQRPEQDEQPSGATDVTEADEHD